MKYLEKYILSLAAIVICSCSNQTTSSVSTSSFDSDSISVEQSNKYVKGKKIFDLEYDIDGYPEETMKLDEFPELAFKKRWNASYYWQGHCEACLYGRNFL